MAIRILHETRYNYAAKVFFEPHVLRLKPKPSSHIHVSSFKLDIYPSPKGIAENTDVENNYNQLCWFEDLHRELVIVTESILELGEFNPFQFLISPDEYTQIPFHYNDIDSRLLEPSLNSEFNLSTLDEYVNNIKEDSAHHTLRFITELAKQIHSDFTIESRETGSPLEPHKTFKLKKGSCRDLSWMLIHILRQSGIAARFVSGYFYFSSEDPLFELHAWVEVFIPGAGWIGLDPSHGILTGSRHIPLASSAFFEKTMPVSGTARGTARGSLSSSLNIEEIGSE